MAVIDRPANVPDIFRWRDKVSDNEVIALFHKRGYGGCFNCGRRRLQQDFEAQSTRPGPLLHASDCVENPESRTAICYAWRSDNSGPHTYTEALQIFSDAQRMYRKGARNTSLASPSFVFNI